MKNKKIGIGIALTLGIVSTIWAGFDQTYGYVTRCEVRASNYVEAEYSKTDTYPCTDINGNSGLCTDTDYWDEPASDVFEAVNVDGQLVQAYPEDVVFKTQGGYYNVPTPPYDQSMSRDYDFDRFSFHNDIEHIVYEVDKADKFNALKAVLSQQSGPTLVFGRTKHGVKKLASRLADGGYRAEAIQGNLSQNGREYVMNKFRSGKLPVLVATNVAARGLDIEKIDTVINFDIPDSPQLFTHRTGRTGRMGRRGQAITFLIPDDVKKWREIERFIQQRFPRTRWVPGTQPAMG